MDNPEEVLHSLEEFSKLKPKIIPRELEDYLSFVAKTGDPVYQWPSVKSLFREKLLNVIADFYESSPLIDIPPCPNVDVFNYETMKTFILEKFDSFAAAPFTIQRICELLTTPRKEYNRIDKYMRALEKNILVVSTIEPGNRRTTENGEGMLNGIETDHLMEISNSNDINVDEHSMEISNSNDINVDEMDDTTWSRVNESTSNSDNKLIIQAQVPNIDSFQTEHFATETNTNKNVNDSVESDLTNRVSDESLFVSIEPVVSENTCSKEQENTSDISVTITAIPAAVQKRRDSIEPVTTEISDSEPSSTISVDTPTETKEEALESQKSTNDNISSIESIEQNPDENLPLKEPIASKEEIEKRNVIDSNETLETQTVSSVDNSILPDKKDEPQESEPEISTSGCSNVSLENENLPSNVVQLDDYASIQNEVTLLHTEEISFPEISQSEDVPQESVIADINTDTSTSETKDVDKPSLPIESSEMPIEDTLDI